MNVAEDTAIQGKRWWERPALDFKPILTSASRLKFLQRKRDFESNRDQISRRMLWMVEDEDWGIQKVFKLDG
ncbi:hypothetical protein ONS96_010750 [Cadophora gregata f. sp. sojae]|nr:hypothetical protein ONS96_010750 [Cadophora gregata f. sp. sojae]